MQELGMKPGHILKLRLPLGCSWSVLLNNSPFGILYGAVLGFSSRAWYCPDCAACFVHRRLGSGRGSHDGCLEDDCGDRKTVSLVYLVCSLVHPEQCLNIVSGSELQGRLSVPEASLPSWT